MDDHNSTVWQGYVAAVASLCQAMLFVMAILTIALAQISSLIGDKQAARLAREATNFAGDAPALAGSGRPEKDVAASTTAREPASRTQVSSVQPEKRHAAGSPPVAHSDAVAAEASQPAASATGSNQSNVARFAIVFVGNADRIQTEQRLTLKEALQKLAQPSQRWRISVSTDSEHRRAAYLRVLEVRRVMIEAGVDLQTIDTRIAVTGETGSADEEMRVEIGLIDS